jgi:plasmid replication initiation protein
MMDTSLRQELIVSSNDLVHAKYDMSLWEKRVFTYAIMHIAKEDTQFNVMRFNIYDILKFFQVGRGAKAYEIIREVPKKLDKVIEIPYLSEKGRLRYGYVRLLKSYSLPGDADDDNQYIELCFNDDLKKDLLELRDKFTLYDSKNIIGLQSVYSFRFFELLKSYEFRGEIEMEIGHIRDFLKLGDKYEAFKDLRTNIIEKAQADLKENCDIVFEFEAKKTGNKFTSIVFKIRKNRKFKQETEKVDKTAVNVLLTDMSIKKDIKGDDDAFFGLLDTAVNAFGVSSKVFKMLYDNFNVEQIQEAIKMTQKMLKTQKIDNVAGYFVEAVRQGFKDTTALKTDNEKKKKEQALQKEIAQKQAEATKTDLKRAAYEKEKQSIMDRVEADPLFAEKVIDKIRFGIFGQYYHAEKTVHENMQNKLFEGAFINEAKKIFGE